MTNKTTITLKDNHSEITITKEVPNIEDMLDLLETALRAHGFRFEGRLTIKNEENDE